MSICLARKWGRNGKALEEKGSVVSLGPKKEGKEMSKEAN